MILTCPECATSYFVPDDSITGAGRRVRCQSCAHDWWAVAEPTLELGVVAGAATPQPAPTKAAREAAPAVAVASPAPELPRAFRARAEQQRRLRRAATHGVVWGGLACTFLGLIGAAWLFRVDVVQMWPRAAAAYAFVGSPVNATGLEFEAVGARSAPGDPGRIVVSGAIRNIRDHEIVAPSVRVALLDEQGEEFAHQVVRIQAAPVLPGGVLGFATLADDPDSRAHDIGVTFVTAPEAEPAAPEAASRPPSRRPLPTAEVQTVDPAVAEEELSASLRPAMEVDPGPAVDATPIDPLDSAPAQAVSAAGHG